VTTPDGKADCYFVHPTNGKHPAVILWPDILGLRPAFEFMAKRLAQCGYAVLVVNPFYRNQKAPVVGEGASYEDEATRNAVTALAKTLSPSTHVIDANAFVAFLDKQAAVNTRKKIGTMGYCMSGAIAFRTATAIPKRIGAVASFHGGGLVNDTPDSPHLLIPKTKAQFLVAIAQNDDQRDLEAKNVLRKSFADAKVKAEVEVYEGALHGWCPLDSRVYNQILAERAWNRLLALFETALG
jgi:carboxymethylenebutenolidase